MNPELSSSSHCMPSASACSSMRDSCAYWAIFNSRLSFCAESVWMSRPPRRSPYSSRNLRQHANLHESPANKSAPRAIRATAYPFFRLRRDLPSGHHAKVAVRHVRHEVLGVLPRRGKLPEEPFPRPRFPDTEPTPTKRMALSTPASCRSAMGNEAHGPGRPAPGRERKRLDEPDVGHALGVRVRDAVEPLPPISFHFSGGDRARWR